jgi:hypothetical protein
MTNRSNPIRAGGLTQGVIRALVVSIASLLSAGLSLQAQLTIQLPDLVLQPDLANQDFTFSVHNTSGSDVLLTGVQLQLYTADGGPGVGGSIVGPAIQQVSVIAPGTLFTGNNNGDLPTPPTPGAYPGGQLFFRKTSTSAGTVTIAAGASAILATIQFSTVGVSPGTYTWTASDPTPTGPYTFNGPSFFTDTSLGGVLNPTLIDGTLTVVPEPQQYALAVGLGLLAAAFGRRWLGFA